MSLSPYRKNVHTCIPVDFFSKKKTPLVSQTYLNKKIIRTTNNIIIFYNYSTTTSTLYVFLLPLTSH